MAFAFSIKWYYWTDNCWDFYLGNEKVFVKGTYEDFFNAEVTGSTQTELLKNYKKISQSIKEKASLRIKETADSIEIEEIKRKAKNLIWEKENEFLFNYANNQMSLHQINYRKKKISKDSLMLFHKRLDPINSRSIIGKELLEYASTIDIQVGDKFRDISGFDLDGKKHSLSEYIGKVILLDFWATGCMPCRIQNKNEFQRIYNQFSEDDFVLMSYSMDTKQNSWKKSSEDDDIKWINISDLKGLKSDNAKAYAVDAIPNSFLIDKNGIVVKTFIGYRKGEDKII